jgi:rhamnulokinase
MNVKCLAVDIGASSGRLIEGTLENGKIRCNEIHRFENKIYDKNGKHVWDLEKLFSEIKTGIKKCSDENIDAKSIGIDTWGVDYVFLNGDDQVTGNTYSYRDSRTAGMFEEVEKMVSREKIYAKTGIQFLEFNTIYQLKAVVDNEPEVLENTKSFLMVPDYFHYLLTGEKAVEFSNATTTQIFNVNDKKWDEELLEKIQMKKSVFPKIIMPGETIGKLKKEISDETGYKNLKVIVPATHDTGSAVAAVPAIGKEKDWIFISSGTWSLMGVELDKPLCTEKARKFNFTNEGGVFGTTRFLKNIMGLWLIQEVKRIYEGDCSFAGLVELAKKEQPYKYLINPDNQRFLKPVNMIEEIKNFCEETGQGKPETIGQIARCVFDSLALQYRKTYEELKEVTGKEYKRINIVGGGIQNKFLNQLCADTTGLDVVTGPVEATAIGNLLMQYIGLGKIKTLEDGREVIKNSFEINNYKPQDVKNLSEIWEKFKKL